MLELNKKCKWIKTIAITSIILRVLALIFSILAEVNYVYDWVSVLTIVCHISVCLLLTIEASKICFSNRYKMLIFPILYLIWTKAWYIYNMFQYASTSFASLWEMAETNQIINWFIFNCAPDTCISILLAIAGYLILFKGEKTKLPLVLLCVSAGIQSIKEVPSLMNSIPEQVFSEYFDLFSILNTVIGTTANLIIFFLLIYIVKEPMHSELTMLRKQKYNSAAKKGLGMKWYKYNIYFRLFLDIITLLFDMTTVQAMYGDFRGISGKIDVYFWFTILFDVALMVGTILTRNWLAHFNEKGIKFYFLTQYVSQIILFMATLLLLGFSEDSFPQTLGRMIGFGVFFALEYRYWKKRSFLFVTSGQSTYMYTDGSNSTQIETPNNSFTICVYDTITKNIRNEERIVDTAKFPPEKFAVDETYYAVEKMNSDKKVRVYCSKSSWQRQVDNQNIDKSKIKFCRKCGFKLLDDSEFCSQCGTKIV